jgi:hypothetical protein
MRCLPENVYLPPRHSSLLEQHRGRLDPRTAEDRAREPQAWRSGLPSPSSWRTTASQIRREGRVLAQSPT